MVANKIWNDLQMGMHFYDVLVSHLLKCCCCFSLCRCADATVKLQLCAEQLSHVSDILPYIEFPEDGGPLTLDWMHSKLEELTMKKSRILNEKRADNTKLAKHKESVLSELEKLRGLNRAHRKLMLEIWPHLTALARVSQANN